MDVFIVHVVPVAEKKCGIMLQIKITIDVGDLKVVRMYHIATY